jgi:hypothetical protein
LSRATAKSLHSNALYSNDKIISLTGHTFLPMELVVKKVAKAFKASLEV